MVIWMVVMANVNGSGSESGIESLPGNAMQIVHAMATTNGVDDDVDETTMTMKRLPTELHTLASDPFFFDPSMTHLYSCSGDVEFGPGLELLYWIVRGQLPHRPTVA